MAAPGLVPPGVAQVPSPRQKVDDDASVPPFKFVTGKLPVTSDARFTLVMSSVSVAFVDPSFLVAINSPLRLKPRGEARRDARGRCESDI